MCCAFPWRPTTSFFSANKWNFPPQFLPLIPLFLYLSHILTRSRTQTRSHSPGLCYTFLDLQEKNTRTVQNCISMQVASALNQYKNSSKNMRAPSSIKQEFLMKWALGLQVCGSAEKNMSVLERKKAIKLSADIAMACTRNDDRTCWSRALIANASKNCEHKALLEHILAHGHRQKNIVSTGPLVCSKRITSKKILKRSRRRHSIPRVRSSAMVLAKSISKRMLKKRTQVLKGLVPGGEFMDGVSLIQETLDYIMSLRVQVDVMRTIANGSELLENGN